MQEQDQPHILATTNWKAIRSTEYQIAILPWGATEAHNYHLPYGTDIILAEKTRRGSSKNLLMQKEPRPSCCQPFLLG